MVYVLPRKQGHVGGGMAREVAQWARKGEHVDEKPGVAELGVRAYEALCGGGTAGGGTETAHLRSMTLAPNDKMQFQRWTDVESCVSCV